MLRSCLNQIMRTNHANCDTTRDSRNRMVLPEASLGEATRSVPKGSPLGSSRVPTHSTDVRIVFALAGGGEAKIYGN